MTNILTKSKWKTHLIIAAALFCEAKPIIDRWRLRKIPNLIFSVYINQEQTICLIITGVGKVKMAAALTFVYEFTKGQSNTCFLNIGIAGSLEFLVGRAVLIHKITENNSERNWYPFVKPIKYKERSELRTYDLPQENYPTKGLIDMEGSAFFQIASLLVTQEQVQVLKVISDCDTESQSKLTEQSAEMLIKENLQNISILIEYLLDLSNKEYIDNDQALLEKFSARWRFSATQLYQLKEYLRRWSILYKDRDPWEFCHDKQTGKHVLQYLNESLDVS